MYISCRNKNKVFFIKIKLKQFNDDLCELAIAVRIISHETGGVGFDSQSGYIRKRLFYIQVLDILRKFLKNDTGFNNLNHSW